MNNKCIKCGGTVARSYEGGECINCGWEYTKSGEPVKRYIGSFTTSQLKGTPRQKETTHRPRLRLA